MIPILRASDAGELKRRVMNRSQLQNEEVSRIVKEIVARVRQEATPPCSTTRRNSTM